VGVGEEHRSLAGTIMSSHGMVGVEAPRNVIDGAPAISSSSSGTADGFNRFLIKTPAGTSNPLAAI
jgi:hypothetical protein